jgi:aspartyl-tRNA(Asn)/glutamyl-tRNA(Gln) amidotransferase subunit B
MTKYEPVIGLEVHTQVKTASKMFCGCSADPFGREPNSNTCPVCLALPGALPVPNEIAVQKTIQLAKSLGCRLAEFSQFERKNYFYPDLPKGFQISQYAHPVGETGKFEGITVRRVHLEEDTGKLIHEGRESLVDFNRSGVPLIEIVTEPEFSDPAVVTKFLKEMRTLLMHLEISDADMEKGSLRLEANISLRRAGEKVLPPYKVELKNINSFGFLEKALRVEIERQQELLASGKEVAQETRGFDEKMGVTVSQRRKEEAFDYRYFPEPDLPPLTKQTLRFEGKAMRTPQELRNDYIAQGVSPDYADILVRDPALARGTAEFSQATRESIAGSAGILINKRYGDLKKDPIEKIVSRYKASQEKVLLTGGEIETLADKVVLDNPAAVRDYATGKEAALQFLLGQLMKESGGKVAPQEALDLLKKLIHARTSA